MTFVSTLKFKDRFSFERNDCVVIALAIAFGVSYEHAHDICRLFGRKNKEGIHFEYLILDALKRGEMFGKKIKLITFPYHNHQRTIIKREKIQDSFGDWIEKCTFSPRINVKTFIKQNPIGTFIVVIRGHVFVIKDSVPHDYKNPQWCEIEYVIQIT